MPARRRSFKREGEREVSSRRLPLAHEGIRRSEREVFAGIVELELDPRPVRFGVPEALYAPRSIALRSGVAYPPSPAKQPRSGFRRSVQDVAWRQLRIRVPERVQFCVSRKSRREVLFAYRRAGYSGSAPKRHYRRSQDSQYRC